MMTAYHAKYFANELTCRNVANDPSRLSQALLDAQVDLNPHQINAALFALRNPLQQGVLLADEVGLGKTIEAGLVLCQLWAEYKRKLLVVCPASLRKQWANELNEKFNLPAVVLDKTVLKKFSKKVPHFFNENVGKKILVVSYQFVKQLESRFVGEKWDLVVIDEVHNLRNAHQKSNVLGGTLKRVFGGQQKLLLSATPLQNSLMDIFGISTLLDEHLFGDRKQFRKYIMSKGNTAELKQRLKPFVHRTLRKNVLEYIRYTKRQTLTEGFTPTDAEQALYENISEFLQRPHSYALPKAQRHLTGLILRKLLASSPQAVIGTLQTIKARLEKMLQGDEVELDLTELELDEAGISEEWDEDDVAVEDEEILQKSAALAEEIAEIEGFIQQANALQTDSKALALLKALKIGFQNMAAMGAEQKAIIFTESTRTQQHLLTFLAANGYADQVVGFNGSNTDSQATQIYQQWLSENVDSDKITGSPQVDRRTALIDHFRQHAQIMVATEAAAEGVNLQFCSLLINYDLPWNPQRIEQRIGRCHRYGQRFDVVVINLLNKRNQADQRVLQLLTEKFKLFDDVFGASDEILGRIESGVDFEKRILAIYNDCRTPAEIEQAFDQLQKELESQIKQTLVETQEKLFDHFDEEVLQHLKLQQENAQQRLDLVQRWFWRLTQFVLKERAQFDEAQHRFLLHRSPSVDIPQGRYRLLHSTQQEATSHLYRLNSALGEWCVKQGLQADTPKIHLQFNLQSKKGKLSLVEAQKGQKGWLRLDKMCVQSEVQTQEYLIFTACTDQEELLESDFCQKLFELTATEQYIAENPPLRLHENAQLRIQSKIDICRENAQAQFRQEEERLERWAEDQIEALSTAIDEAKNDLNFFKRESRQAESLIKQKEAQEKIRDCERKIRRLRNERDDREDEITESRDKLIDKMNTRLKQQTKIEEVFSIRWSIV